eukprot:gene8212-5737_t
MSTVTFQVSSPPPNDKHNPTTEKLKRVAPQIRPAGLILDFDRPGVRELTSSYNPSGCKTPPGITKFHHRGPEVDAVGRHWGLARDPLHDREARYGMPNPPSEDVDTCMRPAVYADKMSTFIGEAREKKSRDNTLKPLGRVPDAKFPIETPPKGFGITVPRVDTSKSIMNCWKDTDPMHPAGEQLCRGYDWEEKGINVQKHRFGVPSAQSDHTEDCFRDPVETNIVRKTVTDYNSTVRTEVGKPKVYGFDNPEEWECNVNGTRVKPQKATAENFFQLERPSMKELLTSWAVGTSDQADALPDDLEHYGRRRRKGGPIRSRPDNKLYSDRPDVLQRVQAEGSMETSAFGRKYLTLDKMDDDATVQQLVHPCHYVTLGVQSQYFAGGRDLENVRALAKKCDFGLTDAQIDEVFNETAKNGLCGIEQFKNAAVAKGYI